MRSEKFEIWWTYAEESILERIFLKYLLSPTLLKSPSLIGRERRASIVAKVILATALIYLIVLLVLPRWEKLKMDSRDFSRKIILDATAVTLISYQNAKDVYPAQTNEDGCFDLRNLPEGFGAFFPENTFPRDPKSDLGFEGKCLGQFWYRDLTDGETKEKSKGFILVANLENDAGLRNKSGSSEGFSCFAAIKEAKLTVKAMKKAISDKGCLNPLATGEIVLVSMKGGE